MVVTAFCTQVNERMTAGAAEMVKINDRRPMRLVESRCAANSGR